MLALLSQYRDRIGLNDEVPGSKPKWPRLHIPDPS
jgi:hypothetical protein